jgi:hypothetical protein
MANKDLKNTPDKVSQPNDRSLIFVPDKISISHIPVGHANYRSRQNQHFPHPCGSRRSLFPTKSVFPVFNLQGSSIASS